jgi:DNA-binding CsgD family transcriptional regulator
VDCERFVGRATELARLGGLLSGLAAGTGGVLLVEGEQGIGKSAVLRAGLAGATLAGIRTGWAAADELTQRFPLRLMTDCLSAADGGLAGAGAERGGAGLALMPSGDPVLAATERLLAAVDRLCAVAPVVLVAEDLHWADEASVLAWRRLARAAGQLPLLLAGSLRPAPARDDLLALRRTVLASGGQVLTLGPLSAPEVTELTAGLLGGRPAARLTAAAGRAGGNPLYVRELVDGLVRDGQVRIRAGRAELAAGPGQVAVPVSLAAAIAERLDSLPPDAVKVLRWAAVLGPEFGVTELALVTGQSAGELMRVIEAALAAGVVAEAGPRLTFRHGLIWHALVQGMPAAIRSGLHLEAARALAGAGVPPERVAAQLSAAPEVTDRWAADWLDREARTLVYRAPQAAADLLGTVLDRLPDADPRRAGLELALITVSFLLARNEDVERVGRRLLAAPDPDPAQAAQAAWMVGYALLRQGQVDEAIVLVTDAATWPGQPRMWTARLTALHAMLLAMLGQSHEAIALAQTALARARQVGDALAAGYALHARSVTEIHISESVSSLEHIEEGLAAIGDDPEATDVRLILLSNKITALADLDRGPEALSAIRESLALAERAGTPRLQSIYNKVSLVYWQIGQWDDAMAEVEAAFSLPGADYVRMGLHALTALISGHREDAETARQHLAEVADWPVRFAGDRQSYQMIIQASALMAELAGSPDEAAAIVAPGLDEEATGDMPERHDLLLAVARLAFDREDPDTLAAAARETAALATRAPLPVVAAAADCCRGLAEGDPAALLAAAEYYRTADRPLNQGEALENAALLLARSGQVRAARQAFSDAVALYAEAGAAWDVHRAELRLRPFGIRRRPGPRPRAVAIGWEALTPTELTIARLVATGKSNPDIAAELYLSRNTVQTHVSHILAKLGVPSRAGIIAEASQRLAAG